MIYNREEYLNKIISRKHNGLIKIITGIRRAGKSFLLNELFYLHLLNDGVREKNIIRFAFDSADDRDKLEKYYPEEPTLIEIDKDVFRVNSKKFRAYINENTNNTERFYLLLDEIQILDNFVSTLNGFLGRRNFDVYVTGSNSNLLSTDIPTEFGGRGSVIHVLPLTFKEYCQSNESAPQKKWQSYIKYGGIPLVTNLNTDEEKISYLDDLYTETYLIDLIKRNKIRKKAQFDDVCHVLASSLTTYVNPLKISNTFKNVKIKSYLLDSLIGEVDN